MAAVVRLRTKLFFWLILGTLSVFYAEVAGGSAPFPFYDAWGLYAVLPLYTLHIVFLSFAVLRPGRRVPITALFCAGAVFGLYEACITKVIWDPTWGEKGLAVGGVYLAQTAMLVLYWHPFMAFLVPLLTSSTGVLDSVPTFLGPAVRTPRVFIGVSKAVNSPTPLHALVSVLSSAAVPGLLVLLWLRAPGADRRVGLTLSELLPDGRQGLVIGVLLAAYYVVTGFCIRPEAMPRTIVPHLTVWALYVLFCGLAIGVIVRAAQRDSAAPPAGALPARSGFGRVRRFPRCHLGCAFAVQGRSRRPLDGGRVARHGHGARAGRRGRCRHCPSAVILCGHRRCLR
ncbi:MAG: hypothetical protein NTU62_05995 [Spirochaetes bacterium]|nr:hypothetical protein [Spirochaetota bacterium]